MDVDAGSHAVRNIAGSLTHKADLADMTGARSNASPGPAMRDWANQLPPVMQRKAPLEGTAAEKL